MNMFLLFYCILISIFTSFLCILINDFVILFNVNVNVNNNNKIFSSFFICFRNHTQGVLAIQNCLNKKIDDIGDKPDDYISVTYVYYGCDESVVGARRKDVTLKRIPTNVCQHKKCKGICLMRSINQYGDKKKKEEKTHPKGFWRRLLERVSCFGHNQRYEDKHAQGRHQH